MIRINRCSCGLIQKSPLGGRALNRRDRLTLILEKELEKHEKGLEDAINRVLDKSAQLRAAVHKIREQGYDMMLVIEVKTGPRVQISARPKETLPTVVRLELTPKDQSFLRGLRIKPD